MMSRSGAAISLVQSAAWLSYTPATTTPIGDSDHYLRRNRKGTRGVLWPLRRTSRRILDGRCLGASGGLHHDRWCARR